MPSPRVLTRLPLSLAVLLALLSAGSPVCRAQQDAAEAADRFFHGQVRPILERSCFECHGPEAEAVEGGLRMTGTEALLRGGHGGPAIVSGDPDGSRLVEAVRRIDPDFEMPPDAPLSEGDVEVLERWVALGAPWPAAVDADPLLAEKHRFFREQVEPVFRRSCFECHGPDARKLKGGLLMASRAALLEGGDHGPALVPGNPDASLLVQAVRYQDIDLEMPPDGPLPADTVAAIEAWVAMGAPWPKSADAGRSDVDADVFDHDAMLFFEQEVRPLLADNCFRCHGPDAEKLKGGLRMTGREALLAGGRHGPALVPGDPEASRLIQAVRYGDPDLQMPPPGPLPPESVAVLERWIALGAPWPGGEAAAVAHDDEERSIDMEQGRQWWAFQPVRRPEVPDVATDGVRNPIDAFVFAHLEREGLAPSPAADRRELVRRAWFDLVGLPPPAREVEAFLADTAPDAWERLVDRLLDMPEYGERWGRHWLDVVRFAQTNGYERDGEKPYAWRYRDWVIDAFNQDKPFDRFILEQLAGDELADATPEARVATGFYHLGSWDAEPDDRDQAHYDGWDDTLRTIGEGFLGVTVGCARCHDHKFDPIRQSDYYGMLAFIRNVKPYTRPVYSLDSPTLAPLEFSKKTERRWEQQKTEAVRALLDERTEVFHARRREMLRELAAALPAEVQVALVTPQAERTRGQRELLAAHAELDLTVEQVRASLSKPERKRLFDIKEQARGLQDSFQGDLEWALVARENGAFPKPTRLLVRGKPSLPGDVIAPRLLPALVSDDAAASPVVPRPTAQQPSSGRRRALAEWIASPENPTTARVAVNRIWRGHFGRGIVPTTNDFGSTGLPPSHPELLDWLAAEFMARGWSVKAMHRQIMNSHVYRQSSRVADEKASAADPANVLLWRQNMRRLEAEAIRDAVLATSGRLNPEPGGRGFFPELSREALAGGSRPGQGWSKSPEEERDRRSVYAYVKRGMLYPMLELFDFANPTLPVGDRPVTTIASQAMMLLNSDFMNRQAVALARRVREEAGEQAAPADLVRRAFQISLARAPTDLELGVAADYLEQQAIAFAEAPRVMLFRAKVPQRLDREYLQQLVGTDLLYGPRHGWEYLRGAWVNPYNGTVEVDSMRGPAALLEGDVTSDVRVEARLRLERGCEFASLLLRAWPRDDVFEGLEVRLDPAGQVELRRHGEEIAEVIAGATADIAAETWHAVAIEAEGPTLTVWLDDGDGPVLQVTDEALVRDGVVGVATWGAALAVEGLTVASPTGAREARGDDPGAPEDRALESFCLMILNLNEFLYVD